MDFDEKLTVALNRLTETGMRRSNFAPPLFRLFWRMGFKVPPPHFRSFAANFLGTTVWFAVAWGVLMWAISWSRQGLAPVVAVSTATGAGLLFGLCMALYYRHGTRKHGIPQWKDFRPDDLEPGA